MPECDYDGWKVMIGDSELSPHDYEEVEVIHNCTVQILRCKRCGKLSIGWTRGDSDAGQAITD